MTMTTRPPVPSLLPPASSASHPPNVVEIATLSMPTEATESGIETGTGTDFVLRAPARVVERFVSEFEPHSTTTTTTTTTTTPAHHHRRDGSAATASSSSSAPASTPCIEGVVDLSAVSDLVEGLEDEGELTEFLRRGPESEGESRGAADGDAAFASAFSDNAANRASDLETIAEGIVVPTTSCAANVSKEPIAVRAGRDEYLGEYLDEERPLLPSISSNAAAATACLVVSADPFVRTLADLRERLDDDDFDDDGRDPLSVRASSISSSVERTSERSVRFSSCTHVDDDGARGSGGIPEVAVSSEAFLISVPAAAAAAAEMTGSDRGIRGSHCSGDGDDDVENSVYVLALPEIVPSATGDDRDDDAASPSSPRLPPTFRSSVAGLATVAAEEISNAMTPFFENAFAPLPTDIRNIQLRVSTRYDDESKTKDDHRRRTSAEVPSGDDGRDEESHRRPPPVHLDVVVDRRVPVVGYFLLVSALLALSSSGVAFDWQSGPTPEMKTLWRFVSTAATFACLGWKSMTWEEWNKFSAMDLAVWIPLAGLNYGFMCTAFVVALEMTSMVNTFILSNLASLIIIGSKFATGSPVLLLEGLGAAIGFLGALICAAAPSTEPSDPSAGDPSADHDNHLATTGNFLAFLASIATAIYLTIAKTLRPKVDLFLFLFLLFFDSTLFLLLYMILFSHQPVRILSAHPTLGLFGWLHPALDRLPLELYSALVCNGVGTAGFIAIMKYFDPVVVSMVMLMEPVFASVMGAAAGVSTLPGWGTWAGDAVVAVGSAMVISSGAETREAIDATGAWHGLEKEGGDGDGDGDVVGRGSTESAWTRGSSSLSLLGKSPLEIRSVVSRRSGRYSMVAGGRTVVKTPRILKSHHRGDEGGEGEVEVEFQSVKGKMRSSSIKSSGHRVVWN